MPETYKIVTVREPWASAISYSLKNHETRSWPTHFRGPLLIHAGREWTEGQDRSEAAAVVRRRVPGWEPALGRVVAACRLDSCLPTSQLGGLYGEGDVALPATDLDGVLGDWEPGHFAWRLADVRPLPWPFPWAGRQGLMLADPALVGVVEGMLRGEAVAS